MAEMDITESPEVSRQDLEANKKMTDEGASAVAAGETEAAVIDYKTLTWW